MDDSKKMFKLKDGKSVTARRLTRGDLERLMGSAGRLQDDGNNALLLQYGVRLSLAGNPVTRSKAQFESLYSLPKIMAAADYDYLLENEPEVFGEIVSYAFAVIAPAEETVGNSSPPPAG